MSLTPRLTMIGMYNYDNKLFDSAVFPEGINKEIFVNNLLVKYGECPVIYPNVPFFKNAVNVWSLKWYDSIVRMLTAFNEEYNPLYNYDRTEQELIGDVGNNKLTQVDNGSTTGTKSAVDTLTHDTKDMESGRESASGTITDEGQTDTDRTVTTTINETNENTVSAFNASSYSPDTKTDKTGEDVEETTEGVATENTRETESEVTTANTKTKTGTETNALSENTNGTSSNTRNSIEDTKNDRTRSLRAYGNIGVTTSQQMFKEEIDIRKNVNIYDVLSEMFFKEFCIYVY